MPDAHAIENWLADHYAPPALVHPFVLLGDDQLPKTTARSNGQTYVATYRSLRGARTGRTRWGGTLWDRTQNAVVLT